MDFWVDQQNHHRFKTVSVMHTHLATAMILEEELCIQLVARVEQRLWLPCPVLKRGEGIPAERWKGSCLKDDRKKSEHLERADKRTFWMDLPWDISEDVDGCLLTLVKTLHIRRHFLAAEMDARRSYEFRYHHPILAVILHMLALAHPSWTLDSPAMLLDQPESVKIGQAHCPP